MFELLEVEVLEIDLEDRVMKTYQKMLTKELFMSFMDFEEMKQVLPDMANIFDCVIKNLTHDLRGIQCNGQEADKIASMAWQKLQAKYDAEPIPIDRLELMKM